MVDGLKIISSRPNGDGISVQSCQGVEVKNSFVRTWDDSLVVKNYRSSSENIHFDNIQIWTDLAQSMEVGYETNKGQVDNPSISDVSFTNICVLHNFHKPIISVHNADNADVHDITFQNITVEDVWVGSGDANEMPYLIDLWVCSSSSWSTTPERGTIHDIMIDNVKVLGGREAGSRIKGYDSDHDISDVTIRNLELFGKKIDSLEAGQFEVDEKSVSGVQVISE